MKRQSKAFTSCVLCLLLNLASCGQTYKEPTHLKDTVGRDGGDLITCKEGSENSLKGDFFLDYVLTKDSSIHSIFSTWEEYRDRILKLLSEKSPALNTSFKDYLKTFLNPSDKNSRIWKAVTDFKLANLTDEEIRDMQIEIPKNCKNSQGGAELQQVVRREVLEIPQESSRKIFYYYDEAKLKELREKLPLQFSYLAVHEWLWDFIESARSNRAINHVFQTESLDELSSSELAKHLESFGIPNVSGSFPDFSTPVEKSVAETFAINDNCAFDKRYIVNLAPLTSKIKIAGGTTKKLKVEINDDNFNDPICGAALLVSHKSLNNSSANVNITISKSILDAPTKSFVSSANLNQLSLTTSCKDRHCIIREGDFEELVTGRSVSGSHWEVTLSPSSDIEISKPFLVFVPGN